MFISKRQADEIHLAMIYARDFSHGTDGHNAKIIIAKMADELGFTLDNVNGRSSMRCPQNITIEE